jgi:hypothetical protein
MKWKPINTCPYDEVLIFYTLDGNVIQDFWYDTPISWLRSRYTHWSEIEHPMEEPDVPNPQEP